MQERGTEHAGELLSDEAQLFEGTYRCSCKMLLEFQKNPQKYWVRSANVLLANIKNLGKRLYTDFRIEYNIKRSGGSLAPRAAEHLPRWKAGRNILPLFL